MTAFSFEDLTPSSFAVSHVSIASSWLVDGVDGTNSGSGSDCTTLLGRPLGRFYGRLVCATRGLLLNKEPTLSI